MGHADIQTTMRYAHHIPKVGAAAQFTEFVRGQQAVPSGHIRDTLQSVKSPETTKSPQTRGIRSAGGGTRTPDTRIMIPLL